MQLFLDSTDTALIKDLAATGLVDGVTTNPSLMAKEAGDYRKQMKQTASSLDHCKRRCTN